MDLESSVRGPDLQNRPGVGRCGEAADYAEPLLASLPIELEGWAGGGYHRDVELSCESQKLVKLRRTPSTLFAAFPATEPPSIAYGSSAA